MKNLMWCLLIFVQTVSAGEVTVRRDERGVPYVEAANDADLYFAQGYVTASDRLWQMELLRRAARGELSEIFGRAALEEDKRRRTYNFGGLAESIYRNASPAARAAVENYARGVNAYLATLDEKTLPVEFRVLRFKPREWRPSDSFVIGKNLAEVLSTTWQLDLARASLRDVSPALLEQLAPDVSPLDVLVVGSDKKTSPARKRGVVPMPAAAPRAGPGGGRRSAASLRELDENMRASFERLGLYAENLAASNNWVVSGKHTATGKPLLANDPHLSASAPPIWYLVSLRSPAQYVAGVTLPGAPGVIIGHNERVAWGVTNLGPDVQDLYLENFDAHDPRRYRTPEGWREATIRREEIKVRQGFADTATEIFALDVTETRHGPIVHEAAGRRYALRWTALDPRTNEFEAFFRINRARNWNEFRAALESYPGPTQNFVYADVDGHIGYYGAGRIPIRRSGDGRLPYDGATDAGEWDRFIPFAELPHSFDPPSGIIVTANSRVVGRDYPYHLANDWSPPYRARRIDDLLRGKKKMTAEDFLAVQGDTYSIGGMLFAKETLRVSLAARGETTASNPGDEGWRATLRLLEAWDGRVTSDSRAALLVSTMRDIFYRRLLAAQLGDELAQTLRWRSDNFLDEVITKRERRWLPKGSATYADLWRECEREARAALAKQFGADETKWTWGAARQVRFPHPLARAPLIGSQFAVQPFPQEGDGGNVQTVNVGANVSMRFVADLNDWDATRHGIALGQSGNPQSAHWKDQLDDWRGVRPRRFPFSANAVQAAARETVVLRPQ